MTPTWTDAACREHDPETWFPVSHGGHGPEPSATDRADAAPAIAICMGCPLVDTCRDWAIANGERHGVWGGMLPYDRAMYAQQHGRKVARKPTLEPVSRWHPEHRRILIALRDAGTGLDELAVYFGVARRTVERWLTKELVT